MRKYLFLLMIGLFLILPAKHTFADAVDRTADEFAETRDRYKESAEVSAPILVSETEADALWWWICKFGEVRACTKKEVKGTQSGYYQNSVMGYIENSIAYMYKNPPADTSMYLAYMGQKAGIVTPAYAQGIGFSGLTPLIGLWSAFRNVAYGFLILVMVVIGFMILFRMRIDPRTVMTVQSALPRIVMTLIMITFSYAIVGLLIDVMYLMIILIILTVGSVIDVDSATLISTYTGGATGNLLSAVISTGAGAINDLSQLLGGQTLTAITTVALGVIGSRIISGGVVGLFGGAIGLGVGLGTSALAGGGNPLIALLVWMALIFVFIRILFTLINAYVQIIVGLIFGPLQIMFGAFQNSRAHISWLLNIIANLGAFVIVMGGIFLAQILSNIAASTANLWTPPGLSGFSSDPTSAVGSSIGGIIGIGIIFTLPNLANALKEALKVKPPIPAGAGAIFAPFTSVYGTAMGGMQQMYYFEQSPLGRWWAKRRKP